MTDDRYVFVCELAQATPAEETPNATWHTILTSGTKRPIPIIDDREVEVSGDMLAQMAANHGHDVPVDLNHASLRGGPTAEKKAHGWIKSLRRNGGRLEALIEWTAAGLSLITAKAYRYFSAEFLPGKHPDTGKPMGWFLRGATLTNHPVDQNVPAIAFAATDPITTPTEAQAGGAAVVPAEVPARLGSEHVAPKEDPMSDENVKALADMTAQITALSDQVKAATERADTAEAKIKALSAELETERGKAAKVVEDAAIKALLTDGKITADEEPHARKLHALDVELFGHVYADRKAGSAVDGTLGRMGAEAADESDAEGDVVDFATAGDKLHALAIKRAADKDEDYATALSVVRTENPALAAKEVE